MQLEAGLLETQLLTLSIGELVLLQLYRLATWVTFSAMDDAAMMAFVFS
jgi:hypothetical protein